MAPLLAAALAATGAFAGWKLLFDKPKVRYVGDYAKVGDTIKVAPDFLMTKENIPWPKGKPLWVEIEVQGGDRDRIQGPLVGLEYMPKLPTKMGSFVVMRSAIFQVLRGGKIVADSPGATTAHGEG